MSPFRLIPALLLVLVLGWGAVAPAVWAETNTSGLTWTQTTPPAAAAQETGPPDYKAWDRTATRAEGQIQDRHGFMNALLQGLLVVIEVCCCIRQFDQPCLPVAGLQTLEMNAFVQVRSTA